MTELECLQDDYCAFRDREYRRAGGQFFTPRWIAVGMAQWVTATKPKAILDPACGFGMLLDACREQGYAGRLMGHELDPELVERLKRAKEVLGAMEIEQGDFLNTPWEPLSAAIVNPPYNRFQRRELPQRFQLELARVLGATASGYTNQYALFLYSVVSRLKPGGRAAFIVPSEFLATGYGVQAKEFLIRNGRLEHLVLFDPAIRIFPEAATTACVLLFGASTAETLKVWHLHEESESNAFEEICAEKAGQSPDATLARSSLDPKANWQGLGKLEADTKGFVHLGVFGSIKRGIATGANEFFVLSNSRAKALGLQGKELVPCIASASSVSGFIFNEIQLALLKTLDKPCFLFDGQAAQNESVRRYLEEGEGLGYHQRYLTKTRKPWYKLESRRPAPMLLAVFGRDGFKVVLNRSSAVNLTAFHGFYPLPEFERLTPLIWLYFQTATARSIYVEQQRSYGDGLKKLEPGDWTKLKVPDWRFWSDPDIEDGLCWAAETLASDVEFQETSLRLAAHKMDDLIARRRQEPMLNAVEPQFSLI